VAAIVASIRPRDRQSLFAAVLERGILAAAPPPRDGRQRKAYGEARDGGRGRAAAPLAIVGHRQERMPANGAVSGWWPAAPPFDHLLGAQQQRRWGGQAEGAGTARGEVPWARSRRTTA